MAWYIVGTSPTGLVRREDARAGSRRIVSVGGDEVDLAVVVDLLDALEAEARGL